MTEFLLKNSHLEISKALFSNDGSIKYLLNTNDQRGVEAIYFPFEGYFDGNRIFASVVCLSSQVGCPIGCTFCETGRMKNPRNLSEEELLSQLDLISLNLKLNNKPPVDSIAIMGMGEPLLNLDNVLKFHDSASNIANIKRFSVSTVGIIPGMKRLKESGRDIKLYISVHTPFNDEREKIIPVSRRYPVQDVINEAKSYSDIRNQKVVANYVLISGINDSKKHSEKLSELLDPYHFDITLNLLNPTPGGKLNPSSFESLARFKQNLEARGFLTDIQLSKGIDISGGCGQLATNEA